MQVPNRVPGGVLGNMATCPTNRWAVKRRLLFLWRPEYPYIACFGVLKLADGSGVDGARKERERKRREDSSSWGVGE